jgi:hypothetical protein
MHGIFQLAAQEHRLNQAIKLTQCNTFRRAPPEKNSRRIEKNSSKRRCFEILLRIVSAHAFRQKIRNETPGYTGAPG